MAEPIHEMLGLTPGKKQVIALCGGGGKTTLLYALARESAPLAKTAIFTTTHIFPPTGEDIRLLEPFDPALCREAFAAGRIVAAGTWLPDEKRLGMPEEETMAFLLREADCVYIEADGSKRLPLKYPNDTEPVLLPEVTDVVVVAGLSALGRETESVFHRLSLARERMEIPETTVTEELMARVLYAGYGRFQPIFFLNQADTPALFSAGERVAAELSRLGAERVAVGSLYDRLREREDCIPGEKRL